MTVLGPGKKKKHSVNPGRPEYVTTTFCDERFQRINEKLDERDKRITGKLETIDKKIDDLKKEKIEESHALRNAIISLIVGGLLALLGYALGKR